MSPKLLVTCLTLPDHSAQATTPSSLSESTASPRLSSTHFDFGQSIFGKNSRGDAPASPPTLAELTLETLLCALVDSPENVKLFETCNGVVEVSRLLRGKVDAGKAAKYVHLLLFPLHEDAPDMLIDPYSCLSAESSASNFSTSGCIRRRNVRLARQP